MRHSFIALAACVLAGLCAAAAPAPPHNLVIFVADGLRYASVSPDAAPEFAAVRAEGVDFVNSHSLYPTVTTVNAAALATGHGVGDTGDFGNAAFLGLPALGAARGSLVAGMEDNAVLGAANDRFGGNYLGETSLLAAARARGFSTAAIGKLGPAAIQDVSAGDGSGLIVDDGGSQALPFSPEMVAAIAAAGLPSVAPGRAAPGAAPSPEQQDWLVSVATKAVLPLFKARARPFVLVFWSRDPDGTQHAQRDSLGRLSPGVNGPTALAAVRRASTNLGKLRAALKDLGLEANTDLIVTADHGFSTISKQSATSPSMRRAYADSASNLMPPGFLALDLGDALGLPVFEPDGTPIRPGERPRRGSALLGPDPKAPRVVIGANGGSDLIWLPGPDAKPLARRIVTALQAQDYTSALFADDALGPIPGTLPLSAVGLKGSARTPTPALVVGFRSFAVPGCAQAELCSVDITDSDLQQGQGNHGGFGRGDTRNFMAALGPSFKAGYADPAPVSNADLAPTAAKLLGLDLGGTGKIRGRIIGEALRGGAPVKSTRRALRSAPSANGHVTVLNLQEADGRRYYDAAGAPGRTFGLRP